MTPPPLPSKSSKTFFHQAATASIVAIPLSIVLNIMLMGVVNQDSIASGRSLSAFFKFLPSGFLVLGVCLGFVALFGIRRHGRKGILVKALIGILVPLGLFGLTLPMIAKQKEIAKKVASQQLHNELTLAANSINAEAPMMVDKFVRLDGAEVAEDNLLIHHHTILADISDKEQWAKIEQAIRSGLENDYRSGARLKAFRENGVSAEWRYNDSSGTHITTIRVGPETLKSKSAMAAPTPPSD